MDTKRGNILKRIVAILLSAFIFIAYTPGLALALEEQPAGVTPSNEPVSEEQDISAPEELVDTVDDGSVQDGSDEEASESVEDSSETTETAEAEEIEPVEEVVTEETEAAETKAPGVGRAKDKIGVRSSKQKGEDDSDELLMQYMQKKTKEKLSKKSGIKLRVKGNHTGDLDEKSLAVYNNLKDKALKVANGELKRTIFAVPFEELFGSDVITKLDGAPEGIDEEEGVTWWRISKETLGDPELQVLEYDDFLEEAFLTRDASEALDSLVTYDLEGVINALLADMPFELFWYDKTYGTYTSTADESYFFEDETYLYISDPAVYVSMCVSANYSADGDTGSFEVRDDLSSVTAAAESAGAIITANEGKSDLEKLYAYKDKVCELASYNDAAADGDADYGDPWQMIYVFDGDTSTNVVCEGYSKAFEYLCDLTNWTNDISCDSVTGYMDGGTGAGDHMWNILHMDDSRNYIADITNSDDDSAGEGEEAPLFLKGYASGSLAEGYKYSCGDNSIVYYDYDNETMELYGSSQLRMSKNDYNASEPVDDDEITMWLSGTDYGDYDGEYGANDSYLFTDSTLKLKINADAPSGISYKPVVKFGYYDEDSEEWTKTYDGAVDVNGDYITLDGSEVSTGALNDLFGNIDSEALENGYITLMVSLMPTDENGNVIEGEAAYAAIYNDIVFSEPSAEYSFVEDNMIVTGQCGYVEGSAHVINSEYYRGDKRYVYVSDVTSSDEDIVSVDGYYGDWSYTGEAAGEATLTIRYKDVNGKEQQTTETITVVDTMYRVSLDTADGSRFALPGEEVFLWSSAEFLTSEAVEEEEDWQEVTEASGLRFSWEVVDDEDDPSDDYIKEFAGISVSEEAGSMEETTVLTIDGSKIPQKDDGTIDENVRIRVSLIEGSGEDEVVLASDTTEINVRNSYEELYYGTLDEDEEWIFRPSAFYWEGEGDVNPLELGYGDSVTVKFQLRKYSAQPVSGEEYDIIDDLNFEWDSDEEFSRIKNEKEPDTFTITRLDCYQQEMIFSVFADGEKAAEAVFALEEIEKLYLNFNTYNTIYTDGDTVCTYYVEGDMDNWADVFDVNFEFGIRDRDYNYLGELPEDCYEIDLEKQTITLLGAELAKIVDSKDSPTISIWGSLVYKKIEAHSIATYGCTFNIKDPKYYGSSLPSEDLEWFAGSDDYYQIDKNIDRLSVNNAAYPNGAVGSAAVDSVTVEAESGKNIVDKEVMTYEDGEASGWLLTPGTDTGTAVVTVSGTYVIPAEEESEEESVTVPFTTSFNINVGSERYELYISRLSGDNEIMWGDSVELQAVLNHITADGQSAANDGDFTYEWEIVNDQSNEYSVRPNVRLVKNLLDPSKASFKTRNADLGNQWYQVRVTVSENVDGETIERGSAVADLAVYDSLTKIELFEVITDENGKETEVPLEDFAPLETKIVRPKFTRYTHGNDEGEMVEGARFEILSQNGFIITDLSGDNYNDELLTEFRMTRQFTHECDVFMQAYDSEGEYLGYRYFNFDSSSGNHDLVYHEATGATCTEAGNSAYYSCNHCNKYFDVDGNTEIEENSWVIPAIQHSWGDWESLDETQHQRVCANDATHIDYEAHVWDAGVVITPATETEEGVKEYTCTVCGETKTEAIPVSYIKWSQRNVSIKPDQSVTFKRTGTLYENGSSSGKSITATVDEVKIENHPDVEGKDVLFHPVGASNYEYIGWNGGTADVTLTYGYNGKQYQHTFTVTVPGEWYEADLFGDLAIGCAGEVQNYGFRTSYYYAEDGYTKFRDVTDSVRTEWTFSTNAANNGWQIANGSTPGSITVTFGNPGDYTATLTVYDASDKKVLTKNTTFRAVEGEGYDIICENFDNWMEAGDSGTYEFELRRYPAGNSGSYEVVSDVDFKWTIGYEAKNVVSIDRTEASGNPCQFTLTRLSSDEAEITLTAYVDGNNLCEKSFNLNRNDYDFQFAASDSYRINSNEKRTWTIDISNIRNWTENGYHIEYVLGNWSWSGSEPHFTKYYKSDCYTLNDEGTQITIKGGRLSGSDIRLVGKLMKGDTVVEQTDRDLYLNVVTCNHVEGDLISENEPTCTETGSRIYECSNCGFLIQKTVPALDHEWSDAVYSWAADNSTVTATMECRRDPSHNISETVTTDHVVKDSTESEEGEETWTATFTNEAFTVQTKKRVIPVKDPDNEPIATGECGTNGNNLIWTLTRGGTMTISGTGAMENYQSDYTVPWKDYRSQIKKVVIQDGVTTVGDSAFEKTSTLTYLSLPDSLTSIGKYAFGQCSSLANLELPDNITELGEGAFEKCSSITTVDIPAAVETLEYYTFSLCTNLKTVTFHEGFGAVGGKAFEGCCLDTVVLPEGTWSIGWRSFRAAQIKEITIPATVTSIDEEAFLSCPEYMIIYGEHDSEAETFAKANNYIFIAKGDDQNIIGQGSLGNGLTYTAEKTGTLTISGNGAMPDSDFPWPDSFKSYFITSIVIGDGVTSIGSNAFKDFKKVTSVTLPESVETIGSSAFAGCTSLCNVKMPESATSIGNNAFQNCINLESITVPNGIETISSETFYGCNKLAEVVLPNSVTSIGSSAFRSCSALESIILPDGVTEISTQAFSGSGITNITIPSGITTIDDSVFASCMKLKNIVIPDGVTSIGNDAFYYCRSMESVTIPASVTNIADTAFRTCKDSLKIIGVRGTVAETYANEKGFAFEDIPHDHIMTKHNAIDPTCFTEGQEEYWTCSVCNKLFADEQGASEIEQPVTIEKLAHTPITIEGKAATCTQTGLTAGEKCSVCETILTEQELIPAKNHTWGQANYVWSEDHTYVTASHTCENPAHDDDVDGNKTVSETVGATGEVIKAPTVKEEGEMKYTSEEFSIEGFEVQTTTAVIEKVTLDEAIAEAETASATAKTEADAADAASVNSTDENDVLGAESDAQSAVNLAKMAEEAAVAELTKAQENYDRIINSESATDAEKETAKTALDDATVKLAEVKKVKAAASSALATAKKAAAKVAANKAAVARDAAKSATTSAEAEQHRQEAEAQYIRANEKAGAAETASSDASKAVEEIETLLANAGDSIKDAINAAREAASGSATSASGAAEAAETSSNDAKASEAEAKTAVDNKAAAEAAVTPAASLAPVEIIDLPAVKISKPKAAKKKITVKWKKVSKKNLKKISGIQIQVATDPGFTNIVKTATAGKKKTSKVIKGLQPKTKYYVRIRAYAAGDHYSVWKGKSAKVK